MRFASWTRAVAWAGLSFVALTGAGAGCGQSFSASGEGGRDATAEGSSSSGSMGSSGSGSGSGSGSSGGSEAGGGEAGATDGSTGHTDAATTCTEPQGGSPSTPGYVECAGKACAVPASVCCTPLKGGADAATAICKTNTATACTAESAVRIECDEPSDCPQGDVCCGDLTSGSQTCATTCLGVELCRCDEQCSGTSCLVCPGYERCAALCN
jgi:hypothetical protein